MTIVPLPDIPVIRARFLFSNSDGTELGSRLFLKYAGGPPSAADLTTLATDLKSAFAANLESLVPVDTTLYEVDCEDLTSYGGNSGTWTGSVTGTNTNGGLTSQVAMNIQYLISRRYRGGKPKGYWPFGGRLQFADSGHWETSLLTAAEAAWGAFISAVNGITAGTIIITGHVNLSYKYGFTNIPNSSGREKAVPKNRPVALHDDITGYRFNAVLGSQRRRRTSTTA